MQRPIDYNVNICKHAYVYKDSTYITYKHQYQNSHQQSKGIIINQLNTRIRHYPYLNAVC